MPQAKIAAFAKLMAGPRPALALAKDDSVERLTEAGYDFKIDADGDYFAVISYLQERRTERVFVSGQTAMGYGVPTRNVFSPASVASRNPLNAVQAVELLGANYRYGMGAWELDGGVLFQSIKLPDSVKASELRVVIRAAAELAGDMELKIRGVRDEL